MGLYTLNIFLGLYLFLNCEIQNNLKILAMWLDLLILCGFTCEIKMGVKGGFSYQMQNMKKVKIILF